MLLVATCFTLVVAMVHFPSRNLFGTVYGRFYFWGSLLHAPLAAYIYIIPVHGLSLMFTLHCLMYILFHSYIAWDAIHRPIESDAI